MKMLHAALAVALMAGSSGMVMASSPSLGQGMGSSQPGVRDLSQNPNWHVYRFWKDGIEYLQVNDLGGNVRLGFGTANGLVIVLPMGTDSQAVSTPDAPLNLPVTGSSVVYQDAHTTLTLGVTSNGQSVWNVAATVSPVAQQNAATSRAVTANSTCDPNDCGINRAQ